MTDGAEDRLRRARDRARAQVYRVLRSHGRPAITCLRLAYTSLTFSEFCQVYGELKSESVLAEERRTRDHEARERAETLCARVHALSVGLGRFSELSA